MFSIWMWRVVEAVREKIAVVICAVCLTVLLCPSLNLTRRCGGEEMLISVGTAANIQNVVLFQLNCVNHDRCREVKAVPKAVSQSVCRQRSYTACAVFWQEAETCQRRYLTTWHRSQCLDGSYVITHRCEGGKKPKMIDIEEKQKHTRVLWQPEMGTE